MIEVVCAIILNPESKIFAARRAPGKSFAGYWEFPGGKIEEGENGAEALQRELQEELGLTQVIYEVNFGCSVPLEHQIKAVQLINEKVAPELN